MSDPRPAISSPGRRPAGTAVDSTLFQRLRLLVSLRLLFCVLLLSSSAILHLQRNTSPLAQPLLLLYGLILLIFLLSLLYAIGLRQGFDPVRTAYLQLSLDTVIVSLVICLTGRSDSVFSFLYLIVIIYSSILVFRRGSLFVAALCTLQYALLVVLDVGRWMPFADSTMFYDGGPLDWAYALYKITFTAAACFAVALLGSMLAEQDIRAKKRLAAIQEQVKRVEKMAMLGEMAAGLAHEIRNPLASMSGAIQLLQQELELDRGHARLMNIVIREADRLSTLLNDFLLFARPDTQRRKPVELSRAIAETADILEKNKRFNGRLTLARNLLPDIWVEMDPIHLRQVLWNLLLNAAEALPEAGRIDIEMIRQKRDLAEIRIRDNGIGIEPDTLASIFDPFFTTKIHGSGLGLSIVHRIVQSYGDEIRVESTPGNGTAFSLLLHTVAAPRN